MKYPESTGKHRKLQQKATGRQKPIRTTFNILLKASSDKICLRDRNKLQSVTIFSHKPRQRGRAPTNQNQCSCEGSIRSERAPVESALARSLRLFVLFSSGSVPSPAKSFLSLWKPSVRIFQRVTTSEPKPYQRGGVDGGGGGGGAEKLRR